MIFGKFNYLFYKKQNSYFQFFLIYFFPELAFGELLFV